MQTADKPTVTFEGVGLTYKTDAGDIEALRRVSFTVEPGEPVALIGPSGCGKSTTLHLVAGLLSPTVGKVDVGGAPVDKPRSATAFIPQNLGLFPWKTVYQNAALGLVIRRLPENEIKSRTTAALKQVGLSEFARAYPKELSGGMRQRLALARALAMDMDLLLMDEPLSAIDALSRETLQNTLLELWQESGHTQMLVTHSINEAVFLGRRIIVMSARPASVVAVVDNPGMGAVSYRDTQEFSERCVAVREALARGTGEVEEAQNREEADADEECIARQAGDAQ